MVWYWRWCKDGANCERLSGKANLSESKSRRNPTCHFSMDDVNEGLMSGTSGPVECCGSGLLGEWGKKETCVSRWNRHAMNTIAHYDQEGRWGVETGFLLDIQLHVPFEHDQWGCHGWEKNDWHKGDEALVQNKGGLRCWTWGQKRRQTKRDKQLGKRAVLHDAEALCRPPKW